jgi:hypothetical protein
MPSIRAISTVPSIYMMFYLFLFNQNIQQSFAGTYFKKVSAACGASIEKTGNYCNLASAKSPKYYSTGQLLTVDD